MKLPDLFDAVPFKSDVKPILSRGAYDVYVGSMEEYKLPVYVILNRDTSVVEFTNEVFPIITDWLNHFVRDEVTAQVNLGQLDLGLVAKN